jgi:hypothetical protein
MKGGASYGKEDFNTGISGAYIEYADSLRTGFSWRQRVRFATS